jgi:putative GTP pyrophosphokinase
MNNFSLEERATVDELFLKYGFALKILETELDILIKSYSYENNCNPVEYTKSRIKSEDSAVKKLNRKGYEITAQNLIDHVHDMIGYRIVCSFLSDVYDIVNLIKNCGKFTIKDEKDYISNPKETGYISYHIIITIPITLNDETVNVDAEIQVRTIAMDFWASLDHKIQYKFSDIIPNDIKEEMYNCSLSIKELDNKMNILDKVVNKYKNGE